MIAHMDERHQECLRVLLIQMSLKQCLVFLKRRLSLRVLLIQMSLKPIEIGGNVSPV